MNEPLEMDSITIPQVIRILTEYKKIKKFFKEGGGDYEFSFETDSTVDNLIKKFGLCWGSQAPFKLMLHPTSNYSLENIATYVASITKEDT